MRHPHDRPRPKRQSLDAIRQRLKAPDWDAAVAELDRAPDAADESTTAPARAGGDHARRPTRRPPHGPFGGFPMPRKTTKAPRRRESGLARAMFITEGLVRASMARWNLKDWQLDLAVR